MSVRLISIIIPVYNVEPYIERCVRSVMQQTYQGPMECILVDDCGTDRSIELAKRIIEEYHGSVEFRVQQHEHNRGLSAARNTGTAAAQGDYIYYLDSDDAMTADCLELMSAEVEKHSGVEMVIGAIDDVYSDSKRKPMAKYGNPCYVDNNDWVRFQFFKTDSAFMGVVFNKLIKADFIRVNSLYFKEGVIHEDDHWSFYTYKKLRSLSIIDQCTYLRYVREGSIMTTINPQKTAENMLPIIGDWVNDFDGFGWSLQVYMCLELFLERVFPYLPKRRTKALYYKFLFELLGMKQFKISFYYFVNRWVKWRYYRMTYQMIPAAHREETNRCKVLLGI